MLLRVNNDSSTTFGICAHNSNCDAEDQLKTFSLRIPNHRRKLTMDPHEHNVQALMAKEGLTREQAERIIQMTQRMFDSRNSGIATVAIPVGPPSVPATSAPVARDMTASAFRSTYQRDAPFNVLGGDRDAYELDPFPNSDLRMRRLKVNGLRAFRSALENELSAHPDSNIRVTFNAEGTNMFVTMATVTKANIGSLPKMLRDFLQKLSSVDHYDDFHDHETNRVTISSLFAGRIAFTYVPASGGCRTQSGSVQAAIAGLAGYKIMNFTSKGNNCGIACLKSINANLPNPAVLRKLIGVAPGVPLTIEHLNDICTRFNMGKINVFDDISQRSLIDLSISMGYITLFNRKGHYLHIVSTPNTCSLCKDVILANNKEHKCSTICKACGRRYIDEHVCNQKRASFRTGLKRKSKEAQQKVFNGFYDFETRLNPESAVFMAMTESGEEDPLVDRVVMRQEPTLCGFVWRDETGLVHRHHFLGLDCVAQFLAHLEKLESDGISLNLYAHNGSRFDALILLGKMKEDEKFAAKCYLRGAVIKGTRLLRLPFLSHEFRDSGAFLLGSLSDLCKSFQVELGKTTSVLIDGTEWKTMDICTMLPKLLPDQFLDFLEKPYAVAYKKVYIDYCVRDCEALMLVWEKFYKNFSSITRNVFGSKAANPLDKACTLPSASMKMFKAANEGKYWVPCTVDFAPQKLVRSKTSGKKLVTVKQPSDTEKKERAIILELLNGGIIGGISHVNLPGHHFASKSLNEEPEKLALVDVVSLYVWAMLKCQYPKGKPIVTEDQREISMAMSKGYFGVYKCTNVVMNPYIAISMFPGQKRDGGRDWNAETSSVLPEATMTNIDIHRVLTYSPSWLDDDGVTERTASLTIKSGIYWTESYNPFEWLNKITDIKKEQDLLKELPESDERKKQYNVVLREACKLIGNSTYGKMMERSVNYVWDEYDTMYSYIRSIPEDTADFSSLHNCNGRLYCKTAEKSEKELPPLQFGVFILAHTRNLMQNYFDMVGRGNIIATETDSIYCRRSALKSLEQSTYPLYRIGKEVGNMNLECDNIIEGYFLGKKCYCIKYTHKGKVKEKYRLKGVPSSMLSWAAYEDLYRDHTVSFPRPAEKPASAPALVMWRRILFSGRRSGVVMQTVRKTIKSKDPFRDYDYTVIPAKSPMLLYVEHPGRYITEEVYDSKRRKVEHFDEANLMGEQYFEQCKNIDIQKELMRLYCGGRSDIDTVE